MRGIYRIDHELSRTHSWLVTIHRRGQIYHRHFADRLHGGKPKGVGRLQRHPMTIGCIYRDHWIRPRSRATATWSSGFENCEAQPKV